MSDEAVTNDLTNVNDIDVKPPAEMMTADKCDVCSAEFKSPKQSELHYEGKKHARAVSQWTMNYFSQMGLNLGKFVWNPNIVHKPKKRRLSDDDKSAVVAPVVNDPLRGLRDDQVDANFVKSYGCPQCRVWFTSADERTAHRKSTWHAITLWENSQKHVRENGAAWSSGVYRAKDFSCKMCGAVCKTAALWEIHLTSKRHVKLANRLLNTGTLDVQPPEQSLKAALEKQAKKMRKEGLLPGDSGFRKKNVNSPSIKSEPSIKTEPTSLPTQSTATVKPVVDAVQPKIQPLKAQETVPSVTPSPSQAPPVEPDDSFDFLMDV